MKMTLTCLEFDRCVVCFYLSNMSNYFLELATINIFPAKSKTPY